jgi:hypothetical protein
LNRDYESLVEAEETEARMKVLYAASHRGGWSWQAAAAGVGLAGGASSCFLGTLLSAGAWAFGGSGGGHFLRVAGNVLLLSTMPLLIAGGCCLDLLEKRLTKTGADKAGKRREGGEE